METNSLSLQKMLKVVASFENFKEFSWKPVFSHSGLSEGT
jgi:hypothetical protein